MSSRDWSLVPLSQVVEVFDGPHATPKKTTEGPWYLNIGSLQGGRLVLEESAHLREEDYAHWTRRVAPCAGDVLFSYETRLGEAAIMPTGLRAALGRRMGILRPRDPNRLLPAFLLYSFLSPEFQAQIQQKAVRGATVDRIPISEIGSWVLRLPPVATQGRIVALLSELDAKIAANLRTQAVAMQLLHSLYRAATTHGAIEAPFLDAVTVDFGEPFKSVEFTPPGVGVPLVRIRDLKTGLPQIWTAERRSRAVLVRPGDVVVGMDAEFCAFPWFGDPGWLNQRVCRLSSAELGNAVLREAIVGPLAEIQRYKTGTTVAHLNKSDLAGARIRIPEQSELASVRPKADAIYGTRVHLASENRRLDALRDTLLPKLISGEIRVRDAEEQVEAVL